MREIAFRSLEVADRDKLLRWRNSEQVARYMNTDRRITPEEHERWFARVVDRSHRSDIYWIVVADGTDVGVASINHIDTYNRRADWAMYIAEVEGRQAGTGTCIEYFVLRAAFEGLKLNKLMGEVLEFNTKVLEMHKRYGFKVDGILRSHTLKDGRFQDAYQISMLHHEWPAAKVLLEDRLKRRGIALPSAWAPRHAQGNP